MVTKPTNGLANGASPRLSTSLPVENPTASFWHTDLHPLHDARTTVELPETADVVIIGAGYAGVATAWHLFHPESGESPKDLSVTILEARGACSGATGRNGGHVRPDLYGHIPTYIKRFGLGPAAELAEFEIAHVGAIKALVQKEGIDCDFQLTRTVDVWTTDETANKAKEVYDMMCAHGLKYMDDVMFTIGKMAEGVSGIKGAKACSTYTAACVWPYKLIMHLLDSLVRNNGVNLQTFTPATATTRHPSGTGWLVHTPRGTIHASKVVHATNAYAKALLPEYSASVVPCKGICCRISVPGGAIAPLVQTSYIIRTDALSYLIPRPDGSIVVGGSFALFKPHLPEWYDNTDDSILIETVKDYYHGYMARTFHGWESSNAEVTDLWTGVMGYSWDSNPHVGAVPFHRTPGSERDDSYVLIGANGHGMPMIWLAAKGLAEMVATGKSFEEVKLPKVLKTTQARIERAQQGPEGGDILA